MIQIYLYMDVCDVLLSDFMKVMRSLPFLKEKRLFNIISRSLPLYGMSYCTWLPVKTRLG